MTTVGERITEILTEILRVDAATVTPTASLVKDLGADSLDTIEIVMACEEEFGIEIPDEDAEQITTVQGIVDYLTTRQSQKK